MIFAYLPYFIEQFVLLVSGNYMSYTYRKWAELIYYIATPNFYWMIFYTLVAFKHSLEADHFRREQKNKALNIATVIVSIIFFCIFALPLITNWNFLTFSV